MGQLFQNAIQKMFPTYDLTGKTWAALVRSDEHSNAGAGVSVYSPSGSAGLLNRGSFRYQLLVPSYTVMFAYFLVLTVGWLFVAERRQGTLKRLRAAPLSRDRFCWASCCPAFYCRLGKDCSCSAPASWCLT